MFRFGDELSDHGLDDPNVAIEDAWTSHQYESNDDGLPGYHTSEGSPENGKPDVGREAYHQQRQHRPGTAQEEYRLPSDSIRQSTPEHARQALGESKGGDEEAGIEGGVALIADVKVFDEFEGVREDGGESDGLGDPAQCY